MKKLYCLIVLFFACMGIVFMKKIVWLKIVFCMVFFMVTGCGNSTMSDIENSDTASCENKQILKILNDEPAIVRKQCFEHVERVDTFYFELVNSHQDEFNNREAVFPLQEIPEQYRKEGLSVYISGNVTSCTVLGGCSEPNIKLASIPLFELKSIKIDNGK